MIVTRKKVLNGIKGSHYLDDLKAARSGCTSIFFMTGKKDKNGRSIAKTFTLSLWKSFVITKYKNIPVYIFHLKEFRD